jgi:hypothetical protein
MPEISDQEYATLKKAQSLLDGIWNDKDHGLAFKKMVKAKMPDARIPEIDIAEPLLKPLKDEIEEERKQRRTLQERLEAKEKAELEAREDADLTAKIEATRKKYRLTDDGMQKVLKRMKDTNNPSPEDAAAWVTDHEPKANPVTSSSYESSDMNLFGMKGGSEDEDIKLLHSDNKKWFDKKVWEINQEFARGDAA